MEEKDILIQKTVEDTECVKCSDEENEVVNAVNNVITTDEKIISMLGELITRVERHGKRSKWAKVAGTTATSAAIGGQVVGLVLAPFTGGLSLWINVASTAVLIGGTMTNVSVNIADIFKSKKYVKKLEEHLAAHDEAAEKFRKMVENIRYVVDVLKKEGVNEDDAVYWTLKHVKDGSLKIVYNITGLNLTAEAIKASVLTSAELGAAEGLTVGTQGLAQTLGITKTAVEGITRAELITFANLVKDPSLLASGTLSATEIATGVVTGVVGVAGVALSAALTIWEVRNLVRDWKKHHPTVNMILDVIDKLRKEKEALEHLCLPRPLQIPKDESCNSLSSVSDDNNEHEHEHPPLGRIVSIYPKLPENVDLAATENSAVQILKHTELHK